MMDKELRSAINDLSHRIGQIETRIESIEKRRKTDIYALIGIGLVVLRGEVLPDGVIQTLIGALG